ncbi:MAG: SAM-dependent chlorinase/fluorinase, partial [Deltaproteobacteria bacterium]|nr:SAM-dependent chlorinase/fluorinase [Deltaproteobacteria bacterium]
VGPDNGLLLPAARALGGPGGCRRLERVPRPTGLPPCETFHGRDLFAPAAALLASGKASPEELGPAAAPRVVPQEPTPPHRVLRVDGFGNLITSLPGEALRGASAVRIAGHLVTTLVRCYADAAPGAVVALAGSSGRVEISAVQGSAAALLRCGRGDPVELLTA